MLLAALITFGATNAGAQGNDAWIGRDKALHFTAGTALAGGGYYLGAVMFESRDRRIVTGLSLAMGAGALKELHDRASGGSASWRDVTWDAVGAATGVTIGWLIDRARGGRPASAPRPTP